MTKLTSKFCCCCRSERIFHTLSFKIETKESITLNLNIIIYLLRSSTKHTQTKLDSYLNCTASAIKKLSFPQNNTSTPTGLYTLLQCHARERHTHTSGQITHTTFMTMADSGQSQVRKLYVLRAACGVREVADGGRGSSTIITSKVNFHSPRNTVSHNTARPLALPR